MDHSTKRIFPRGATPNRINAKGTQSVIDQMLAEAEACGDVSGAGTYSQGACPPKNFTPAYAAQTSPATPVAQATGSAVYTITPAAPFKGGRLLVQANDTDLQFLDVTSVKVGIEEHILSGPVSASEFGQGKANAGTLPLRCWAGPALPITVTLNNRTAAAANTTGPVGVSYQGIMKRSGC